MGGGGGFEKVYLKNEFIKAPPGEKKGKIKMKIKEANFLLW